MKYSRLGDTGLIVSRLSLGTMTFTNGNKMFPTVYKVDAGMAGELVAAAFDAGINFFDTANMYAGGESETLLGAALKGRRNDAVLATKGGLRMGADINDARLSRRNLISAVDQSLARLGTDWIDLYILHCEDPYTPLEETLRALDDIVKSGKVRYIGFSNWSAWRAAAAIEFQKANGLAQFCNGQYYYSLVGRDVERDVLPMARHMGIGVTVWSPLAAGFLTGKYTSETMNDPDNRYSGGSMLPFDMDQGYALVDQMRGIAEAHDATIAQIALAWLLSRDPVSSVIVGASSLAQLTSNLASVDVELTQADVALLDGATPLPLVYPNWYIDGFMDQATLAAVGPA